jgi:hypothetical protein
MRLYRVLAVALLVLSLAGLRSVAMAAGPYTDAALGTLGWIATQQQADGSFAGFGAGNTADAVFAICAVGGDPNGFLVEGNSPVSYLAANVDTLTSTTGGTAKTILAAVCANKDPRSFAGLDLVAEIEGTVDSTSGQYGSDLSGHAFAMLALKGTNRPIPDTAVSWLRTAQTPEGGWGWDGTPSSGNADTNSTSLAIQGLVAAGVPTSDTAIQNAIAYLHTQQNDDGGFPYANPSSWGTETDANSTAYVIQGLVAAGEDPEGSSWTVKSNNPMTALLSLRLSSGAFLWQAAIPGENALATYQAVPAMMLKTFPMVTTTVGDAPAVLPETGAIVPTSLATLALGMLLLGWSLRQSRG